MNILWQVGRPLLIWLATLIQPFTIRGFQPSHQFVTLADLSALPDSSDDSIRTYHRPPEEPLFARVRTWTDVLPWLRLVRVARLAGAPVWIVSVAVVHCVWRFGLSQWTVEPTMKPTMDSFRLPRVGFSDWGWILWTIMCWTPMAMVLIRLGVLLTSGRDLPGFVETIRLVARRWRAALVILFLPALCSLPFLAVIALFDWITVSDNAPFSRTLLLAPIAIPSAIVAALLLVGSVTAIPFGLAALVSQQDADPMDCLSRGFEVTFRRLPQLVLLALPAIGLMMIVVGAWTLVGTVAASLTRNQSLASSLAALPIIIGITLGFAMMGGIYLLLRQSAGGQEVEDVWEGPRQPTLRVPSVKATSVE